MSRSLIIPDASKKEDFLYMAYEAYRESSFSLLPYDEQKISRLFDAFLAGNKTDIIIIFSILDELPVGLILGVATSPIFSDERIAAELIWWAEDKKSLVLLAKAYEEWARRVNCKAVTLGKQFKSDETLLGFTKGEESFIKEIKWDNLL